MTYDEISSLIIKESNDIVYMSDPYTYEMVFLNHSTLQALGNPPPEVWRSQTCYQLMQNRDAPCAFCTNHLLSRDRFYCWEHYNEKVGRYYYIKDKLVELDGRLIRLEIATDGTEKEQICRQLKSNLEMKDTLVQCIQTLSQNMDLERAINSLLAIIGGYYQGERAYIFECDHENSLLINTYEWCKDGVEPMIDNLQALPLEAADRWMEAFRTKGEFYISALDENVDKNSDEYAILEPQGIQSLITAPLMEDGRITGFIGVDNPAASVEELVLLRSVSFFVTDDIVKRRMNAQLQRLSYTDALTGLWNRTKYVEMLHQLEIDPPAALGIGYVDINGLKAANDTHGHQYGDRLIRHTADLMNAYFAGQVYRVGGDEFVLFCTDIPRADFQARTEQLRTAFHLDEEVSVSFGAKWGAGSTDVNKQLVSADELMYIEKQRYYSSRLDARGSHRAYLSKELLREIDEGGFVVFLQPKVLIKTGLLCGAEALVRRVDEQGNCLPPAQFIPRYEAEGIIRHVDFFVLDQVCQLLCRWRQQGHRSLCVAVNLSRLTLMEQGVVDEMRAVCARHSVSPQSVAIEVTESMGRIGNCELRNLMAELKAAGFSVSLDDFGAEYSNLAILSDLEFNEVKLDKSLIDELEHNGRTRIVAAHAIDLFRELDKTTSVAEGVETLGQLDMLDSMQCEVGQGYYFDAPLPVAVFEEKYLQNGA